MSRYSIVKLIPYFGKLPVWMDFYLASCRANKDIHWRIYSDAAAPKNLPENVTFIPISFADYKKRVSECLAINFDPASAYKLCDLKPALGFIHQDEIKDYDFFAFGDLDVIYGNIRHFYTDNVLAKYQMLSTHADRISGHFAVLKNTALMREAFKQIPNWQTAFCDPAHLGLDESKFSKVFLRHKKHPLWLRKLRGLFSYYQRHVLFKEQYSTILSPKPWFNGNMQHPTEWLWQDGALRNTQDGDREFLYLHFMNFKSNTWLPKPLRERPSAWMQLENILHMDPDRAFADGFRVTPRGFEVL